MPVSVAQTIMPCPQCGTGVKFRVDASSGRESCPHCGYVLPNQMAHFKLTTIIGIGGMGAVYRGLDTSLERSVAVKVMREGFAKDPQFVERFLREARAAAALNHPHVAQIYSFGEQNGRYYLVIELLPHGSLDDRIEKEKRLPEVEVLDIGIQVASGLKAAYEKGLIHRDIKPGNILFAQDGSAKVVDFGLARFEAKENPHEEGIWGTPYYIAPEKVSDNKEDFRSDIYSLGGTLFHALAGRPPFEAGTSTEVVLKHLHSPAVSLCTWVPDCTSQSAEVIGRMLKRDPADRPQSYDELLNDLAYAKRFALEKKPPEPVKVESEFTTGMLVSSILIFLVAIGGAGWWFWTKKDDFFGDKKPPVTNQATPTNNVTSASPGNNSSAVKPPTPPPPPAVDYQIALGKIQVLIEKQTFPKALRELRDLEKEIPEKHPLAPWVKIHYARLLLLQSMDGSSPGKDSQASQFLKQAAGPATTASLLVPVNTSQYSQLTALILSGQLSGGGMEKYLTNLPDWMIAMAHLDAGLAALSSETTWVETRKSWKTFSDTPTLSDHHWILGFQEKTKEWLDEYQRFAELEKKHDLLQADGKIRDIQKLLKDEEGRWKVVMVRRLLEKLTEQNQVAIRKLEREEEEQKNAELTRQKEAEKKLIDDMNTRKTGFLKVYQFDPLREGWAALESQMKTPENLKLVKQEIATAQSLSEFKTRLSADLQTYPYEPQNVVTIRNKQMTGKLHSMQKDKLLFRFEMRELGPGQYAETSCLISELAPSTVLMLGDFYLMRAINTREPNNSDIARRSITLALLVREYRLNETWLSKYLSYVKRTGANVQDTLDALNFPMP